MLAKREVTVEEALAELGRLFPNAKWITISGDYTLRLGAPSRFSTRIQIAVQHPPFGGETLAEVMNLVRNWKESQSS